jgi:hypothetical protein
MSKPIVWVHGDSLSPYNPALQEYPKAPAIWVWDEELIEESQLSLKRITFIYECLLELPLTIRRGKVAQEILKFAQENHADLIVTSTSPSPRFNHICDQIEKTLPLETWETEPFFEYEGYIDLKRFSRYWKIAEKHLLT